jgi:hypothetical protein
MIDAAGRQLHLSSRLPADGDDVHGGTGKDPRLVGAAKKMPCRLIR